MNYHAITKDDMLNGEGLRAVLWVSGCAHHCEGCHNPYTWDPTNGMLFDEWAMAEFFDILSRDYIQGATFTGGDPLHPANRQFIARLCDIIKSTYKDKDIWLYTGYELTPLTEGDMVSWQFYGSGKSQEIFSWPGLDKVDVLKTGRFNMAQRKKDVAAGKDPNWVGDSTQKLIDVKRSLEQSQIVLYK